METTATKSVKHLNQLLLRTAGNIMRIARSTMSTMAAPLSPGTDNSAVLSCTVKQYPHAPSFRVPSFWGLSLVRTASFEDWLGQPTENGGNKHQGLRECKRDDDTFGKCDVLKIKIKKSVELYAHEDECRRIRRDGTVISRRKRKRCGLRYSSNIAERQR